MSEPPPQRARASPSRGGFGWGLAAAMLAVWAAQPTLSLGFVHDDRTLIEHSTKVGRWETLPEALSSDLFWLSSAVRPSPYWRPWISASYYLDHALGAGAPWSFHLHNAVLVLLLACMVWWVAGRDWRGVVAAAVMVLHPAFVEPMANITARTDLYVALLGTAAVTLPGRWRLVALGWALCCKETAVVIPVIWALSGLSGGWRAAWRASRAGWLMVGAWALVRAGLVGGRSAGAPWEGWGRIPGTMMVALERIVLPAPGPHPDVDLSSLSDMGWGTGVMLAIAMLAGLGALARMGREWFAPSLVALPLVLTSGLAGPGIRMADGLLTWAVVGTGVLVARLPGRGALALVPLVVVLAMGHRDRVARWATPESLWAAALEARPDDGRVQLKAGRVLLATDPVRARALAQGGVRHPDPRLQREGHELTARALLLMSGRSPTDDEALRTALRRAADPSDPEAGWACAARCVWDEQPGTPSRQAVCDAAVARDAATGDVWNTLGILSAGRNELVEARAAFARAAAMEPDRAEFRDNLALAERLLAGRGEALRK